MNLSRRTFLKYSGLFTLAIGNGRVTLAADTDEPYADNSITDAWITEWIKTLGAATETLHLGRFADAMYFLREQIGWRPNPGQENLESVDVPVGFVTDFASIPRAFWQLLPKDGAYTYPAIIHDYLYWEQQTDRKEADLIFKYAMEDFKVGGATIKTVYAGVRAGGRFAWYSNAKRKAAGERRVLTRFPDDPTVTWKVWKERPDVF